MFLFTHARTHPHTHTPAYSGGRADPEAGGRRKDATGGVRPASQSAGVVATAAAKAPQRKSAGGESVSDEALEEDRVTWSALSSEGLSSSDEEDEEEEEDYLDQEEELEDEGAEGELADSQESPAEAADGIAVADPDYPQDAWPRVLRAAWLLAQVTPDSTAMPIR